MVDQNIEQETPDAAASVEQALSSLWEKAREASLLISTLREEKRQLLKRIDELEEELLQSKKDVEGKQDQIEQLQSEGNLTAEQSKSFTAINSEEKKILEQKLKNIIGKLEQYL